MSSRPLFRFDPGWLFVIAGLGLCAGVLLAPARADLAQMRERVAALQHASEIQQDRLEAYSRFLDDLGCEDPPLVRRLAASQLNVMPADRTPLLMASTAHVPAADWVESSVPRPKYVPARHRESKLDRLSAGNGRLWLVAAGVLAIFLGLVIDPAFARRPRREAALRQDAERRIEEPDDDADETLAATIADGLGRPRERGTGATQMRLEDALPGSRWADAGPEPQNVDEESGAEDAAAVGVAPSFDPLDDAGHAADVSEPSAEPRRPSTQPSTVVPGYAFRRRPLVLSTRNSVAVPGHPFAFGSGAAEVEAEPEVEAPPTHATSIVVPGFAHRTRTIRHERVAGASTLVPGAAFRTRVDRVAFAPTNANSIVVAGAAFRERGERGERVGFAPMTSSCVVVPGAVYHERTVHPESEPIDAEDLDEVIPEADDPDIACDEPPVETDEEVEDEVEEYEYVYVEIDEHGNEVPIPEDQWNEDDYVLVDAEEGEDADEDEDEDEEYEDEEEEDVEYEYEYEYEDDEEDEDEDEYDDEDEEDEEDEEDDEDE